MKRDAPSGILLIAGAVTGVLVMAVHPTAHSLLEPGAFSRQAHLIGTVHGLALASVPILFLGLLGLTRRLGWSQLAVAALQAIWLVCVGVPLCRARG
jgi:heme/copper-type cytochrome/quinol oxidase subunit 1